MDTLTHFTLGAAVGELVLGKKVGNKALLWGAVGGVIPDLDYLVYPFLDTVSRLTVHRSFSHSITFLVLVAPLLGFLINKIYKGQFASWWDWTKLSFWSIFTHSLLDNFTSYGTQLFWPFSKYRIAWNSIFVIDPLYTVPFALCVLAVFFLRRGSKARRIINWTGIILSTSYLLFTLVNKQLVSSVFEKQLKKQNISYSRIFTMPTPFNNILWRGVAESQEGFWEGYYSWFDDNKNIQFRFTPKNYNLIAHLLSHPDIQKIKWMTRGFFAVTEKDGAIFINDMRYGRLNGWQQGNDEFIFAYKIVEPSPENGDGITFSQQRVRMQIKSHLMLFLFKRIMGNGQ